MWKLYRKIVSSNEIVVKNNYISNVRIPKNVNSRRKKKKLNDGKINKLKWYTTLVNVTLCEKPNLSYEEVSNYTSEYRE